MDSLKIEDYIYELIGLCSSCKRAKRCKDHHKLCLAKKLAFNLSVIEYKKRVKRGEIK